MRYPAFALLACLMSCGPTPAMAQGCGPANPNCIVPTAPTGTSNNQAASTAFVMGGMGGVMLSGPAAAGNVPVATSSSAGVWESFSLGIDASIGATRGSILERGAASWGIVAPGTSGLPWVSNGTGADPAYQALTNAGHANAPANTVKCNPTGSTAVIQDCTVSQVFNSNPWVDVKSGTNSCAAAVGNGSTDDTTAIQCQITFMNVTFGGGTVFFPCATYHVTATLTVPGGVRLKGAGRNCAVVSAGNNDVEVLNFTGGGNTYGGLEDMWIVGDLLGGALTKNLVVVNVNTPVVFRNCMLWGGNFALQSDGVDGSFTDCFIMGTGSSGGGIHSLGANWYQRVKLDTIGVTVAFGYQQGPNAAVMENHFINSDFSGSFSSNSVSIVDSNNQAVTTFQGSVFSNSINITGGKYTMFVGDEFGVASASSVNMSIVGSFGFSALTMTGTGVRSCAGNSNITC